MKKVILGLLIAGGLQAASHSSGHGRWTVGRVGKVEVNRVGKIGRRPLPKPRPIKLPKVKVPHV